MSMFRGTYHENGIPHMWIKAGSSQKTGCGRKPSGREETELFEAVHWGMSNRPGRLSD